MLGTRLRRPGPAKRPWRCTHRNRHRIEHVATQIGVHGDSLRIVGTTRAQPGLAVAATPSDCIWDTSNRSIAASHSRYRGPDRSTLSCHSPRVADTKRRCPAKMKLEETLGLDHQGAGSSRRRPTPSTVSCDFSAGFSCRHRTGAPTSEIESPESYSSAAKVLTGQSALASSKCRHLHHLGPGSHRSRLRP